MRGRGVIEWRCLRLTGERLAGSTFGVIIEAGSMLDGGREVKIRWDFGMLLAGGACDNTTLVHYSYFIIMLFIR